MMPPLLAGILLATGQWLTYHQAAQQTGVLYQRILELTRRGVLLSLYAPRSGQAEGRGRYVWQPDLLAYFPNRPPTTSRRGATTTRTALDERSPE